MGDLLKFPGVKAQQDAALLESRLAEVKVLGLEQPLYDAQKVQQEQLRKVEEGVLRQWTATPGQLAAQEQIKKEDSERLLAADMLVIEYDNITNKARNHIYYDVWFALKRMAELAWKATEYTDDDWESGKTDCDERDTVVFHIKNILMGLELRMPPIPFAPPTLNSTTPCLDTPRYINLTDEEWNDKHFIPV